MEHEDSPDRAFAGQDLLLVYTQNSLFFILPPSYRSNEFTASHFPLGFFFDITREREMPEVLINFKSLYPPG